MFYLLISQGVLTIYFLCIDVSICKIKSAEHFIWIFECLLLYKMLTPHTWMIIGRSAIPSIGVMVWLRGEIDKRLQSITINQNHIWWCRTSNERTENFISPDLVMKYKCCCFSFKDPSCLHKSDASHLIHFNSHSMCMHLRFPRGESLSDKRTGLDWLIFNVAGDRPNHIFLLL